MQVVSVPPRHPYVQSVTATSTSVFEDLAPAGAEPGQWWPPAALDPEWIRAHADDADLLHIHFGTESFTPEHLRACIDAAHAVGWPVVFTVHDIEHPQLDDRAAHLAQLNVLVPGADALITLTEGAAAEIRRRWNRVARVLRHPAVMPTDTEFPLAPASPTARVGVHLKDLRPNVNAVQTVALLAAAMLEMGTRDVTAEVRMHHSVRDDGARETIRAIASSSDRIELVEHDRLDDRELAEQLARLDAYVLPYGHGTHSGWLELCWDLAVPVLTPRVGYYAEQHRDDSAAPFVADPSGASMASAIATILDSPGATRAGSVERLDEMRRRRALRVVEDARTSAAHAALYESLVAESAK